MREYSKRILGTERHDDVKLKKKENTANKHLKIILVLRNMNLSKRKREKIAKEILKTILAQKNIILKLENSKKLYQRDLFYLYMLQ